MMDKLIAEVRECVEKEYGRVCAHTGFTYHSDHEAHSIILEEAQEAEAEYFTVNHCLDKFWNRVKEDDTDDEKFRALQSLETYAVMAACEFIQVAVTAKKAAGTVCERGALREFRESVGKMHEDLCRNRPR